MCLQTLLPTHISAPISPTTWIFEWTFNCHPAPGSAPQYTRPSSGGKEVDVINLDLSKAFDRVSHNLLSYKLYQFGISGQLLMWFKGYLTDRHQRVVLNGAKPD